MIRIEIRMSIIGDDKGRRRPNMFRLLTSVVDAIIDFVRASKGADLDTLFDKGLYAVGESDGETANLLTGGFKTDLRILPLTPNENEIDLSKVPEDVT